MDLDQLDEELRKVSKLPAAAKTNIMDFDKYMVRVENLSVRRRLFYIIKLRKLQEEVGIFPLTSESVLEAMEWVRKPDRNYKEWTVIGYQTTLAKIWRFNHRNEPDGDRLTGDLRQALKKRKPQDQLSPDQLVERQEIKALLEHSNTRDRAILSLLYSSGIRHGELLYLRNKDLKHDRYGAVVDVPKEGKTGKRTVRITGEFLPYIMEWERQHPNRNNGDAWLFCGLEGENYGKQLKYSTIYKSIRLAAQRAGITKRIYPHLLRHTRASYLATKLPNAPLEKQMGWVHGSAMTNTYLHLKDKEVDNAVLLADGYKPENQEEETKHTGIRSCPMCMEKNNHEARFCWKCGYQFAMKFEEAMDYQPLSEMAAKHMEKLSAEFDAIVKREVDKKLQGLLSKINIPNHKKPKP